VQARTKVSINVADALSIGAKINGTISEIRRLIGRKLRIVPTQLSFNALARSEPFRVLDDFFIPKTREFPGYPSVKIS